MAKFIVQMLIYDSEIISESEDFILLKNSCRIIIYPFLDFQRHVQIIKPYNSYVFIMLQMMIVTKNHGGIK